jgi:ribosomal protein L11 methyltransferase
MPFLQLTLTIGAADPEPYEEALSGAGALSITLQDAADDPVLEPLPGTTPLWRSVRIQALFETATSPHTIEHVLRAAIAAGLPELQFETLADRVWEREWLRDFRPMRFGDRLWICPGGQRPPAEESTTGQRRFAAQCIVELDPGLAFGTGTHATTALCLEWLDQHDVTNARVIDYGCGSGVLAIAALKLGAREAVAVDIDPQALIATHDNAIRNGVADRMTVRLAETIEPQPGTIVLANILAEPLEALAPRLARLVTEHGQVVMSGILATQAKHLATCYAPWFEMVSVAEREGWARLCGVRRAHP